MLTLNTYYILLIILSLAIIIIVYYNLTKRSEIRNYKKKQGRKKKIRTISHPMSKLTLANILSGKTNDVLYFDGGDDTEIKSQLFNKVNNVNDDTTTTTPLMWLGNYAYVSNVPPTELKHLLYTKLKWYPHDNKFTYQIPGKKEKILYDDKINKLKPVNFINKPQKDDYISSIPEKIVYKEKTYIVTSNIKNNILWVSSSTSDNTNIEKYTLVLKNKNFSLYKGDTLMDKEVITDVLYFFYLQKKR